MLLYTRMTQEAFIYIYIQLDIYIMYVLINTDFIEV